MRRLYQYLLKPILFRFDPERIHNLFVNFGEALGRSVITRRLVAMVYGYHGADAAITVDGITYRTPVLLAAGFDYDGRLTGILKSVAFGGEEIGSVTARPSVGNPPPRLTRLIRSKSLLVNKGLRNEGVEKIIQRLRETPRERDFVIGISIARTNDTEAVSVKQGIADYRTTLQRLVDEDLGDFYTLNISCPNIFGGESFAEPTLLRRLLEDLKAVEHTRPIYVKMPITLADEEFEALLEIIVEFGLHGVVIGNLNKDYQRLDFPDEAPADYRGGISGRPCFDPSTRLIRRTREKYGDRLTIIGCGGILSAELALKKFRAGADLVQLITGMIFEGPHLMKEITSDYVREPEARPLPSKSASTRHVDAPIRV